MRVTKAKDRETMALQLEALAEVHGVAHERIELGPREICVEFQTPEGLRCHMLLDGDSRQVEAVLPWYVRGDRRLSAAFEREMGASVNPHHRLKCTCVAPDFQSVLWNLRRGFEMSKDGSAWEPQPMAHKEFVDMLETAIAISEDPTP